MLGIYDCFTITVIRLLEDLGFCEIGEGGPFVEGGAIVSGQGDDGLALMDDLGVTDVVLPELTRLQGVEQSGYHPIRENRAVSSIAYYRALEREGELAYRASP